MTAKIRSALLPRLNAALRPFEGQFRLRAETSADYAFLASLYCSTRWEELVPLPWPEQSKREFLEQQFALQHAHYRKHYLTAEWMIIERQSADAAAPTDSDSAADNREPSGRIYVDAGRAEFRLMDIALLPEWRGRGVGAALIGELCRIANGIGVDVTLHVEPTNPAQRLYRRLGFEHDEQRGAYDFLRRRPSSPSGETDATAIS